MTDSGNLRAPADAQRINVNETYEVRYWTHKFGITEARLRQAVRTSGPMVANVKSYLNIK